VEERGGVVMERRDRSKEDEELMVSVDLFDT
jgi:hypothetical protein